MWKLAALYLPVVNLLTYAVFWLDKRRAARGGRRIPERELVLWALAGGSPAAWLAVRRLRHKTRKPRFKAALWAVVLVQLAVAVLIARS